MAGFNIWQWWVGLRFSSQISALNYCTRAKDRLLWQFKNKTNIEKYLCVFAEEFQELETTFQNLQTFRKLSTAEGVQLDGLGEIVGVERKGLSDTDYRTAIQTQAILNSSNGEPESIREAVTAITDSAVVNLTELPPATLRILFDGLTIPSDLRAQIESYAAAGVQLVILATYGEDAFSFESDPGETPLVGDIGFSEPNYVPDAGKGGALTESFE